MEQRPFAGGWPFEPAPRGAGMSREERTRRQEALAQAPLFASLSSKELRSLAEVTSVDAYDQGAQVVKEGSTGTTFHVLLDGRAEVVKEGATLARLGPGDFFGEIAVLDGGPRTASVVAGTPLKCLTLSRGDFMDVLDKNATLAGRMLHVMAGRLRSAERSPVA